MLSGAGEGVAPIRGGDFWWGHPSWKGVLALAGGGMAD